ncbi:tRNA (guanosine(37)-N1)-methyltransferase TrmD, partial [Candidatus Dojkabacteria bacterium]|nr:tRNA (guanosine(37)-N1)-methyltransferase TrmD [Candidatus Dojkabacteria bacterium]
MSIHFITIFPDMFSSPFNESIIKRAQEAGLVEINVHDLRKWTEDDRSTVDDKPFGGGAGMVMMIEPFYRAVKEITSELEGKKYEIIVTSAKGENFTQNKAKSYSQLDALIILCGHYEGIDERVTQNIATQEISIGNYVLTGGELPAMVIADATLRLIPGVLGNEESLHEESFHDTDNKEYPQFTRPAEFVTDEGDIWKVPDILLSGNHQNIDTWRKD